MVLDEFESTGQETSMGTKQLVSKYPTILTGKRISLNNYWIDIWPIHLPYWPSLRLSWLNIGWVLFRLVRSRWLNINLFFFRVFMELDFVLVLNANKKKGAHWSAGSEVSSKNYSKSRGNFLPFLGILIEINSFSVLVWSVNN